MAQPQASVHGGAARSPRRPPTAARLFFSLAAIVILVIGFIGFSRFYLHGGAYPDRELTPPIKWLVIVHGVTMSAWLLLLVLQPMLVAARNYKLHMRLGKVGAVLAVSIVIFGFWLAIRSAQVTPANVQLWGLSPKHFMAVSCLTLVVFGAFVALGVVYRRVPHLHRSMMLQGTLFALGAAFDRIDPLKDLYVGTIWGDCFGPYFWSLVLGVLMLGVRSTLARKLDVFFAVGLAVIIAAAAFTMRFAQSSAWDSLASILVK